MSNVEPPREFAQRAADTDRVVSRLRWRTVVVAAVIAVAIVAGGCIAVLVTGKLLLVAAITFAVFMAALAFGLPFVPMTVVKLKTVRRVAAIGAWVGCMAAVFIGAGPR